MEKYAYDRVKYVMISDIEGEMLNSDKFCN